MLGKRRWLIESFFKTAKHRFGLHRFGQATLLGVYRWLVLSLIAYFLAHLACLWSGMTACPDWFEAAHLVLETLFPSLVVLVLLYRIKRYRHLFRSQGLDVSVQGWQYG